MFPLRGASRLKINSMVGMKPLAASVRGSSSILIYVILWVVRESWNLILMFIHFHLVWFLGDSCPHSISEGKEAASSMAANKAFSALVCCPGSRAIWGYQDLNLQNVRLKNCSLHNKAVWQSYTLSSSRTLLGGPFRGMWRCLSLLEEPIHNLLLSKRPRSFCPPQCYPGVVKKTK